MKHLLILLIFLLSFNIHMDAQEFYLKDSSTMISIFGGTSGGIFRTNYSYDDKYRLISELSEYSEITYAYTGDYDYVRNFFAIQQGLVTNQIFYKHNDDGFVIEELSKQYNYQSQELDNSNKKVFERDNQNRLIANKYYVFNQSGQPKINQEILYEYNDVGISKETLIYYNINGGSIYLTGMKQYEYVNDQLKSIYNENEYPNQINHSIKDFEYDQDQIISTKEVFFTNNVENYTQLYNYEYTDEGYYIHQFTKFDQNSEFMQGSSEYRSEEITPFYEHDSIIFSFQFEGEVFEEQKTINSVHYSPTEDTAIVRRVLEGTGFEGFDFLQITKEIYFKFGASVNTTKALLDVANIYPNPVSVDHPIQLEKIDKNISSYRIINQLGQTIDHKSIWNHEKQSVQAPSIAGNYLIQFYDEKKLYGKTYKLLVF